MVSGPLFSVIIPYYNSSATLSQCINSILSQSFSNFELVLVDDGSADCSYKIAEFAALHDARIFNYRQVNQGVSAARNYGISKSTGNYLLFVDSDDWVDVNYLLSFVPFTSMSERLVVQGYINDARNEFYCVSFLDIEMNRKHLFESDLLIDLFKSCAPFGKLYSRDIVSTYGLMFDVNLSYGEDLIFLMQYLSCVKYINFSSSVGYYYRVTNIHSLSNRLYSFECEYYLFSSILKNLNYFILNVDKIKHMYVRKIFVFSFQYLMRSIASIYNNFNIYSANKRLEFLAQFAQHRFMLQLVFFNYKLVKLRYKIVVYLLLVGKYRILDSLLCGCYFFKRIVSK